MTKKELVKLVSEETGLSQLKTEKIVQCTFDAIIDALTTAGRIELRNFGVFKVKKRPARKGRNPRTGNEIDVAEKYIVTFKPGKEMEAKVARLLSRNEDQQVAKDTQPAKTRPAATESPFSPNSIATDSSARRMPNSFDSRLKPD